MAAYATVEDITILGRPLTVSEQEKASQLLDIASAKLRVKAAQYGRDIDLMISAAPDLGLAVKETVVRVVLRALNASETDSPTTQSTMSALGYSQTVSYLNAGQTLYFLKNELKDLGIIRQRYGAMEVYDVD